MSYHRAVAIELCNPCMYVCTCTPIKQAAAGKCYTKCTTTLVANAYDHSKLALILDNVNV